jgi:hypothetical protein
MNHGTAELIGSLLPASRIHLPYFKIFLLSGKQALSAARLPVQETAGNSCFDGIIPTFRKYPAVGKAKRLR